MTARVVICRKCQNKVSVDHIRYDKNGRDLICVPCYQRGPMNTKPVSERERYICMRCNYKFSWRRDSRIHKKCPYCSSPNITQHETVTAQNVLQEVAQKPNAAYLN